MKPHNFDRIDTLMSERKELISHQRNIESMISQASQPGNDIRIYAGNTSLTLDIHIGRRHICPALRKYLIQVVRKIEGIDNQLEKL